MKGSFEKGGVNPDSLGHEMYIASAKKLNAVLRPYGIGVHLVGRSHDREFYTYLWMQGGEIIKQKSSHPTKGIYWFLAFNSTEGVKALGFIKAQVDAGVKPKTTFWGRILIEGLLLL